MLQIKILINFDSSKSTSTEINFRLILQYREQSVLGCRLHPLPLASASVERNLEQFNNLTAHFPLNLLNFHLHVLELILLSWSLFQSLVSAWILLYATEHSTFVSTVGLYGVINILFVVGIKEIPKFQVYIL
jgi:hypothetical protein